MLSEYRRFEGLSVNREYCLRQAELCHAQAEFCEDTFHDYNAAESNRIEAALWEQAARAYDNALDELARE